ncbi:MAG TPA: tetratricopeptide repeat protein [Nitrospiria bacterium]|nr:tetratricopeptide repeat protein [Nitrospiria bacterium]
MTARPVTVFTMTVCAFLAACSGAAVRREPPATVTAAPDPAALFTRALTAQESGNAERAQALWRQLIAAAPTQSAAHTNLGILLRQAGNTDEAIREYETAIRLDPRDAWAYHNLGVAHRLRGAWQDAERAYRRAIELRPDQMDSHYNLGILYELYLNRPEEALTQYRAVLSHGGPDADTVAPWVRALERRLAPAPDAPTPETR